MFAAALMALPATAGSHKTLSAAQLDTRLKNYVLATRAKNVVYAVQPYMESYSVDDARRVLTLNVSTGFAKTLQSLSAAHQHGWYAYRATRTWRKAA